MMRASYACGGHVQCSGCTQQVSAVFLRPTAQFRLPNRQYHIQLYCSRVVRRKLGITRASDHNDNDKEPGSSTTGGVPALLFLLVGSAAYTLTAMRGELAGLLYSNNTISDLDIAGLGLGGLIGALMWSVALWYVSPLQLLLVFLGRFESERPSDWIIDKLGRATGQPVDVIDYVAPLWIRATTGGACIVGGLGVAAALGSGLGDATWSVASGLGALFGAAIFELGRPQRLTVQQAQTLEAQWQDFAAFAGKQLQRTGRCHETEVFSAFRRSSGKYRSPDVLSDSALRDMVRNWHPGVERTRTGYLRNISVRQGSGVMAAFASSGSSGSSSRKGQAAADSMQQEQQPSVKGSDSKSLLDSIAEAAAADRQQ